MLSRTQALQDRQILDTISNTRRPHAAAEAWNRVGETLERFFMIYSQSIDTTTRLSRRGGRITEITFLGCNFLVVRRSTDGRVYVTRI